MFILRETINGENLATSLEIESASKIKPKNIKMISTASVSLLVTLTELLLSHSCAPTSECVCVINREAHSLFIFFRSLESHSNMSASLNNYLIEPTSLGVSNNPSAPQLVGTFPPSTNKEVYP